ncbi:MAG: OmpA family protein [Saprospiraceae bacterium]|nr:OmpA family protein [Bacteroidia bacterium]NNL92202.1 OmpA family protein [Saprospiraceae bacterium]
MKHIVTLLLLAFLPLFSCAQMNILEGHIFETDQRGHISEAVIQILKPDGKVLKQTTTDKEGYFLLSTVFSDIIVKVSKSLYNDIEVEVRFESDNPKKFLQIQLDRLPGYLFEVTIKETENSDNLNDDGFRIDVYNNTKEKEEMVLINHRDPVFTVPLIKENHYSILIRKDGLMSKRIEAFVDIEGCILCFEGLGSVGPGVSQSLSENNNIGVLLADVSMNKAFEGKKIKVENIYYALGKWDLTGKSKSELNKLSTLMKDNPRWIVELGSHTDSRGNDYDNLTLSEKRAQAAVDYLVEERNIDRLRISSKGYGETQIINRCKDNVECSDIEHSKNRRTEIKIVGISEKMRYQSLAEMKKAENANALLSDVRLGGRGMVPIYDESQDSILNAIRDSIALSIKEKEATVAIDTIEIKDDPKDPVEEKTDNINIDEAAFVRQVSVEKEDDALSNMDENIEEEALPNTDESMEDVASHIQQKSQDVVPDNSEVLPDNVFIKIVIKESSESLPQTDDIYKSHENIYEIYHNGKFKYLFGEFKSMKQAEDLLTQSLKLIYPDAYIVKFSK